MFNSAPKQHSHLLLKLLLRKTFLNLATIEHSVALDLFAGSGEISSRLYLDFEEIHLVEKDPKRFAGLKEKFSHLEKVHLWQMNNLDFLKEHLRSIPDITLVDFDAYGSPNHQILEFFKNYPFRNSLLIFATDGGRLARIRARRFNPALYFAGPEQKSGAGYDPVLTHNYQKLIQGFWKELAKIYGFEIKLFKLLWNKTKGVAYYGLWLAFPK